LGSEGEEGGEGSCAPNCANCQSPMKPRVVLDADEKVVRRDLTGSEIFVLPFWVVIVTAPSNDWGIRTRTEPFCEVAKILSDCSVYVRTSSVTDPF